MSSKEKVTHDVTISADQLHLSEIGANRMLGWKVNELLLQLEAKNGIGDATLVFVKWKGGYHIHGSMETGRWKPVDA